MMNTCFRAYPVILLVFMVFCGCNRTDEARIDLKISEQVNRMQPIECSVMVLDKGVPAASGFFIEDRRRDDNTNTFFVTAAHVYNILMRDGLPVDFRVRHRVEDENNDFTVLTGNSSGSLLGGYQRGDIHADVVVARVDNMDEIKQAAPQLRPYVMTDLGLNKRNSLHSGDTLFAVGLLTPLSTVDEGDKGELLMRQTKVAAMPQSLINVRQFCSELIIADHQSWMGCSGAPVFKIKREDGDENCSYELIGMTTGYVTRDSVGPGNYARERLALTYVTPLKYILFAFSAFDGSDEVDTMKMFSLQ